MWNKFCIICFLRKYLEDGLLEFLILEVTLVKLESSVVFWSKLENYQLKWYKLTIIKFYITLLYTVIVF